MFNINQLFHDPIPLFDFHLKLLTLSWYSLSVLLNILEIVDFMVA